MLALCACVVVVAVAVVVSADELLLRNFECLRNHNGGRDCAMTLMQMLVRITPSCLRRVSCWRCVCLKRASLRHNKLATGSSLRARTRTRGVKHNQRAAHTKSSTCDRCARIQTKRARARALRAPLSNKFKPQTGATLKWPAATLSHAKMLRRNNNRRGEHDDDDGHKPAITSGARTKLPATVCNALARARRKLTAASLCDCAAGRAVTRARRRRRRNAEWCA